MSYAKLCLECTTAEMWNAHNFTVIWSFKNLKTFSFSPGWPDDDVDQISWHSDEQWRRYTDFTIFFLNGGKIEKQKWVWPAGFNLGLSKIPHRVGYGLKRKCPYWTATQRCVNAIRIWWVWTCLCLFYGTFRVEKRNRNNNHQKKQQQGYSHFTACTSEYIQ